MFNIIDRRDPAHWNAIGRLVAENPGGPLIASQNRPEDLRPERWARNVSVLDHHHADGEALLESVVATLTADEAAIVMIDELRGGSKEKIAEGARMLRERHPELAGRWGTYVVSGTAVSYPNLQPAVDELLAADAIVAVEYYVHYRDYCASGATSEERDAWLADFYLGGGRFPGGRFRWLMNRRRLKRSDSRITVLFGVTDDGKRPGRAEYMDGPRPAEFLDRLFYVWVSGTPYPEILAAANGGAGSWKWDAQAHHTEIRDEQFAESWNHYCRDGKRSPRFPSVECE